jgi:hypothetical protein
VKNIGMESCRRLPSVHEIAGDTLPLQGTPNLDIDIGMHHNRLMMSIDSFAHLPIRVRKLRRCHAALRS